MLNSNDIPEDIWGEAKRPLVFFPTAMLCSAWLGAFFGFLPTKQLEESLDRAMKLWTMDLEKGAYEIEEDNDDAERQQHLFQRRYRV